MPTLPTITVGQDGTASGTTWYGTATYIDAQTHTTATNCFTIGLRFLIPSTFESGPDITIAKVTLRKYLTSTLSHWATVESNGSSPEYTDTTNTLTGSAWYRKTGAAISGSTPVSLTSSVTDATDYEITLTAADVSTAIAANTDHATTGTYLGVLIYPKATGSPASHRFYSIEHTTLPEAKLDITYAAPANFTADIGSGVVPTPTVDALLQDYDVDCTSVSALGGGAYANIYRKIDVYVPRTGTKPSGGWPVVLFVHGGRWVTGDKALGTSENYTPRALVEKLTDSGYAVAAVNYRTMNENVNTGAIYRSFPQNVHDIYAAMEYLHTNASDYDIDSSKMVLSGHSAGGHLAAFAAIAAATSDSTAYNGSQNSTNDRPAGYGYTDTASPWQFDLDEYGELSAPAPAGIMLWDAPVNVYLATTIADPAGTFNKYARLALLGDGSLTSTYSTEDEIDLNYYLDGNGTKYTSAKSASAIPPIFFMYSTNQDVVLNSASINAIETALDNIGYDTSAAAGVLNTVGGLTKHSVARNHADVLRNQAPNFTEEIAWLSQVTTSTLTHYVGSSNLAKLYVGSTEITKAYKGTSQILPRS